MRKQVVDNEEKASAVTDNSELGYNPLHLFH